MTLEEICVLTKINIDNMVVDAFTVGGQVMSQWQYLRETSFFRNFVVIQDRQGDAGFQKLLIT